MSDHQGDLIVACPRCSSSLRKCKRPSGHDAAEWHVEREDAYAQQCRCVDVCSPWLDRRGIA